MLQKCFFNHTMISGFDTSFAPELEAFLQFFFASRHFQVSEMFWLSSSQVSGWATPGHSQTCLKQSLCALGRCHVEWWTLCPVWGPELRGTAFNWGYLSSWLHLSENWIPRRLRVLQAKFKCFFTEERLQLNHSVIKSRSLTLRQLTGPAAYSIQTWTVDSQPHGCRPFVFAHTFHSSWDRRRGLGNTPTPPGCSIHHPTGLSPPGSSSAPCALLFIGFDSEFWLIHPGQYLQKLLKTEIVFVFDAASYKYVDHVASGKIFHISEDEPS